MKNLVFSLATLFVVTGLSAAPVFSAGSVTPTPTPTITVQNNNGSNGYGVAKPCPITYGGGTDCPTQNVLIDKTVKNPDSAIFVDSLSINDPKYAPAETVTFRLNVTNTSNQVLTNLTIRDVLPNYLTYTDGISGASYSASTNTVSFTIKELKVGETKSFTLNAKIAEAEKLPQGQGIVCLTNQSFVNNSAGQAQDNAQFCIEKEVIGLKTKGGLPVHPTPKVTSTPSTGAESLLALIPMGLAGMILRRKKFN